MKIYETVRLFIVFISFIIYPLGSYGMHGYGDFDETPLGYYQSKIPPNQIGGFEKSEEKPSTYNIITTPVKDQGPLGTCVSFTASACGEYCYKKPFSEAEFTILSQTDEVTGNKCIGGLPSLGKALEVAKNFGFIEDKFFPYELYLEKVANKNGLQIKGTWKNDLAKKEDVILCNAGDYNGTMEEMNLPFRLENMEDRFKLPKLYPIHHVSRSSLQIVEYSEGEVIPEEEYSIGIPNNADISSIEEALLRGFPVATTLKIYKDCWDHEMLVENNYVIKKPDFNRRKESGYFQGYHAVVLTGFDSIKRIFTLKNSWGTNWGKEGLASIPYDYISCNSTELIAIGQ